MFHVDVIPIFCIQFSSQNLMCGRHVIATTDTVSSLLNDGFLLRLWLSWGQCLFWIMNDVSEVKLQ